jgi:putative hydrolase of the HAD superfamily
MSGVRGVTFDFYETLAHHGAGRGRGACLMDYFSEQGLTALPWEHRVLYDVFEYYGEAYRPDAPRDEARDFWVEFAARLFDRLGVRGARPEPHAEAVRRLLGAESLRVYDDAPPVLDWLRRRRIPVGIVSNWQRGLSHFCRELGLLERVDFVVASAEVGLEKPDRRIFELAARRMGLAPEAMIHVGDHPIEDVGGAREAGFSALLLTRDTAEPPSGSDGFRSLSELPARVETLRG